MSGPGAAGWRAGWSITSSSKAGPSDTGVWQQLTNLLGQTWAHASGAAHDVGPAGHRHGLRDQRGLCLVATSRLRAGGSGQRRRGFNRSSPVTGPTYVDATIAGKRLRRGARLWTVATSTFKTETYRYLRQERPTREEIEAGHPCPPGTIHLPNWADGEWLKQFTAEQLITVRTKRGFARLEWQKLRERNEALDTRVYARGPPLGYWALTVGPMRGGLIWKHRSGSRRRTWLRTGRETPRPLLGARDHSGEPCAQVT